MVRCDLIQMEQSIYRLIAEIVFQTPVSQPDMLLDVANIQTRQFATISRIHVRANKVNVVQWNAGDATLADRRDD